MTTKNSNPTIIFHRGRNNAAESLARQQKFLKRREEKGYPPAQVIDHPTRNSSHVEAIKKSVDDFLTGKPADKINIIFNSHLTINEHRSTYDYYSFFTFLKAIGIARLYFLDPDDRLYREVEEDE